MVADLAWDIQLSETQIWQREQIILTVTVPAPDSFAMLKTDKLVIPSMEVVSLPAHRKTNSAGQEQLIKRWQLYPHSAGKQAIQLPAMRYYLNGGTREKWLPPLQHIEVQALPPYFPPTLPIGEVVLNSRIVPSGILRPNSLAYWHLSLHSTTVTTAQFPSLLKQLQATSNLDVLPATVSVMTDQETGIFRLNYRIPVKAKGSGRLDLPHLQWHWFNPKTARLEKKQYNPQRPWVLALWQQITLILSGIVLLGIAGYGLGKQGLQYYRRWRCKYQVMQQIQQTTINDASLHKAMMTCAKVHGWTSNFSIRQWLESWEQYYGKHDAVQQALLTYESRRFAKKPV